MKRFKEVTVRRRPMQPPQSDMAQSENGGRHPGDASMERPAGMRHERPEAGAGQVSPSKRRQIWDMDQEGGAPAAPERPSTQPLVLRNKSPEAGGDASAAQHRPASQPRP
ncbi:hypothetical protein HKCCE3408_19230, partial [Rhodobacterales bacterium HKCCE3408]|nr:hypothetical protein [Rhodobacterales bacterium HKCCE3408]